MPIKRTTLTLDDDLLQAAMRASGLKTKRATVEAALRLLVQVKGQTEIRKLRGKVTWQADLDAMREQRR
jgi:Arc/MetJ family transcription regulator